jgi:hypothetical protein
VNNLIRGKGGLIMGIMHTKAERTEKVKEIKAENEKKVKRSGQRRKSLMQRLRRKLNRLLLTERREEQVLHSDWLCLLLYR